MKLGIKRNEGEERLKTLLETANVLERLVKIERLMGVSNGESSSAKNEGNKDSVLKQQFVTSASDSTWMARELKKNLQFLKQM